MPQPEVKAPSPCPICGGQLIQEPAADEQGIAQVRCNACGDHRFVLSAVERLPRASSDNRRMRARLAHGVSKLPAGTLVLPDLMDQLAKAPELPGALERIDRLILHLVDSYEPGDWAGLYPNSLWVRLGCVRQSEASWVIEQAHELGFVGQNPDNKGLYSLSANGWQRHAELLRKGARSTHAFMAMRYDNTELEQVFHEYLVPAVKATGYELRNANDPHQAAGSIDDSMRVDIRTSRFVVCDLSDGNRGAYWEAASQKASAGP